MSRSVGVVRFSATLLVTAFLAMAGAAVHAVDPVFTDRTGPAGLTYQQHTPALPPNCLIPTGVGDDCEVESMTGGAAAADYDGDGRIDLYVTVLDGTDHLFRNLGGGVFDDVTVGSGLDVNLRTNGAAWGDIDNDGDLDLFLTSIADTRYYLFVNDGTGFFTEEAVARGADVSNAGLHFGFSVAFGDYDLDGFLDIHVTEWRRDPMAELENAEPNARLLRNRGRAAPGHFEDTTDVAGVSIDGLTFGGHFGFATTFSDLDDDGWPDLAMACDFGTSRLFWNDGDGTFTDGTALATIGTGNNEMGSTIGDYDGDGRLDWFVTAIYECSFGPPCSPVWNGNRLFRNAGGRVFADATDAEGVRNGHWGWGTAFVDCDNDADLDLVMTNGVDFFPDFVADPMRFWRNDGAGAMPEISGALGVTDTGSGKGLLSFDHDDDGDLDLFVVNNKSTPVLYRNDGGNTLGWVRVNAYSPAWQREALGAKVSVQATAGGATQVAEIGSVTHFLAQSESTAHFGLGAGTDPVHEVRVRWPGASIEQVYSDVPRDSTLNAVAPQPAGGAGQTRATDLGPCGSGVEVTWDAVTAWNDPGGGVRSYRLYVDGVLSSEHDAAAGAAIHVPGDGALHDYRIVAVNAYGQPLDYAADSAADDTSCGATPPEPVPDGEWVAGTPMAASKTDATGSVVDLTWDVGGGCASPDHHLLWGHGANLRAGSYQVEAAVCGLGTTGSAQWSGTPVLGAGELLWWVVVGNDAGSVEGSWGRDSSGAERNPATVSGLCGLTLRDSSGSCN